MSYFVNTLSIQRWAETVDARTMLPHVLRRLTWGTLHRRQIKKIDFPAYESGQRPGFDGEVVCTEGNAWVPAGHTVWELSVDGKKSSKAGGDFDKRTEKTPAEVRLESTYVCVSARKWRDKKKWEATQQGLGQWKAVRVLDADDLEQWMEVAPGVATWFALKNGDRPADVDDVEYRWEAISKSTKRSLTPQVFLVSRDANQQRVHNWLCGDACELVIESRSPSEVIDFFCADLQAIALAERLEFIARSVIVESLSAWKTLRNNDFPAILVVDPSVQLSAEEIGRAVTRGHHVLLAAEPRSLESNNQSLLERASEFDLAQALESCGFTPVEAEQLARASGGSLAILKRKLGRVRMRQPMAWSDLASPPAIVAALLLGGWNRGKEADRAAIESISENTYTELEPEFQRLATCRDPLLFHAAGNWRLLSKDEAWFVLGDRVTPSNFDRFCSLAVEILADDDPKFALPDEERPYARIKGHTPRYSQTIKTHVAQTVAFLGAFGDKLGASSSININAAVARVVRDTLSATSTWHRWASIGTRLALLAEASPKAFLGAVREDLDRSDPELVKLFHDDGDPLFGSCNHAGLLWALETLAWSKQFLPEVSRALLRLTASDPHGRWANRPDATLCEIFCHWMPHTTASVDERIQLLDMLIGDRPETTWNILVKMLPKPVGDVSIPTHRPMWRDWANSWTRGATRGDSLKFISNVGERVIRLAGSDAGRWKEVFDNLSRFPYTVHSQLIAAVRELADAELSDADRRLVSDKLSEQLNHHRYFQDANWSLPEDILDQLETCLSKLKPKNPVLEHAWLFEHWPYRFFKQKDGSYQDSEAALEKARDEAIVAILEACGFDGVAEMIMQAGAPGVVGGVVARVTTDRFLGQVIPRQISLGEQHLNFVNGFVWTRFRSDGWSWVDAVIERCSIDDERASILVALPFESETWVRAEALGETVQTLYWQRCRAWNHELTGEALRLAVDRLVEHARPRDAIDLLAMAIHGNKEISTETLMRPLESLLQLDGDVASQQIKRGNAHDFGEVIEALQDRADIDHARLTRLEWNFLALLDEHGGRSPKTLHRHLCENSAFFVEILVLIYRSRHAEETEERDVSDESRSALATQAWRLLHDWKRLPGTNDDGAVDVTTLDAWCTEARRLAADCGRIEICDSHLGQLFAHAPSDPDGRWPCEAVRRVIESIASESIGSGLHCGIMNSRGVVWRAKGGDQERELAEKYRKQADAIRFDAPFTAEVLDDVAVSYEHEAHDWDERDRWND